LRGDQLNPISWLGQLFFWLSYIDVMLSFIIHLAVIHPLSWQQTVVTNLPNFVPDIDRSFRLAELHLKFTAVQCSSRKQKGTGTLAPRG
jgi:hypothetical protein